MSLLVAGACESNPLSPTGADAAPDRSPPGVADAGSPPVQLPDAGRRDLGTPPLVDARPALPDLRVPPPDAVVIAADATSGGGCNTVAQQGPQVAATCSTGVFPIPVSGTIVDGTYVLTQATEYGTCGIQPLSVAETVVLQAGTFQAVATSPTEGVTRTSGTFTLSGTQFLETDLCPQMSTSSSTVGATPTGFMFVVGDGTAGVVVVFTRL